MNIKQQAIFGAKWTTISTLTTAVIQVLRLSILARFLDKSDFGIVAILTFVLGLTNTFADLGFSAAIMHKQELSRNEFASLYWIQMFFFLLLFGIGCSLSTVCANFYNEDSITYLLPVVLLDLVFNGIGRLYDTVLQKDMLFKTIAVRNIVSAVLSIIIAMLLALMGYGIYSMILSTLFNTLTFNIWNFICGQKYFKLKFRISIKDIKPLVQIGLFQTGTQILDYFAAKFDILIIGKLLGTENLGIYNLSKELVMKVILLINTIANKVVLPIFANIQKDREVLRLAYCKIITLLSRINFPISACICVLSSQIVGVLYGEGYEKVAELTAILSFWSLFLCLGNPVGALAVATGKTNLSLYYTILRCLVTLPCVYIASCLDITAVAWSNCLLGAVMFLLSWKIQISQMIGLRLKDYLSSFRKEITIAFFIVVPLYVFFSGDYIPSLNGVYTQLLLYGAIFFGLYVLVLYLSYGSIKKYLKI